MTNRERMEKGMIYNPMDEDLMSEQLPCIDKLADYNATKGSELAKRAMLLKDMLGSVGENCYIEPPFRANWGGKHVHIGKDFYSNFNLVLVDDGNIYIGDNVMLAPNVVIATAAHPLDPQLRNKGYQYNLDVHIGNSVWIGAGVLIMPGVTIGDGSVIGAGSVVTKDIPANVVAVGNPCRVMKEINEYERTHYAKGKPIDID